MAVRKPLVVISGDLNELPAADLLSVVNVLQGYSTTATAAGTTTLTVSSSALQYFTGSTTQTVKMPVTSTLTLGQQWLIVNLSTGAVTVQSSGSNTIVVLAAGTAAWVTCTAVTGTSETSWDARYFGTAVTSGKKLSVSNTLTIAGTDGTTMTFPGSSDTVVTLTATQTISGKRITRRSTTTAGPGATPTINTDTTDYAEFTALAAAITSMTTNLTGTPNRGDTLWISFTDNGTARAITWGASFEASGGVGLPTTTVISTRLDVGFTWNVATSKWRCVAVS